MAESTRLSKHRLLRLFFPIVITKIIVLETLYFHKVPTYNIQPNRQAAKFLNFFVQFTTTVGCSKFQLLH